jgi:hypothetical protein
VSAEKKQPSTFSYARAAGRVGGRALRSNRYINAGLHGARITLRSVGRTTHILWLEITGIFFLLFVLVGGGAAVRGYRMYQAGRGGVGRIWLGVAIAVVFAYFAVTSFARSRKRS